MKSIRKSRNRFILLSLTIPVILLMMFVVYPSLDLIAMSFTSWDGISPHRTFIGVGNYIDMFTKSPDLWLSLRNNFIYLAVHMVMIPIELSIAVMLNTKFKGAGLVKTIAFLPFIINGVGMSYAFSYFFSPVNGAFNDILTSLGLSGWIQNWLSDPKVVNFVLASVSAWRFSGYHIVLFSTGLTSIPTEVMEAARIDGANAWQQLWRIQLPSIWLVFSFVMFDCIRGTLQCFDIPFIMTNGGPGYASSTFTLYTIDTAFKYNSFGMAATMAVAIMVIVILVYLFQNVVLKKVFRQ
ncbi:carbohydrate ABC transporter permease [uncultured Ruthenibacterium sp.]|uniref:carbohydrate ABC transporter permease n=1 Tax=uncultured Ruthenibacterium sp. TaxID=1905347 RepID=UPI00349EC3EA